MGQKIKEDKKKLAVAMVVFILLIILFSPLRDKIENIVGFREQELQLLGSVDLKWSEDINIAPHEERIIVSDKNSVTAYSYDNVKLWKKDLKDHNGIYLGKTGSFINNKDNSITKLDLKGKELWSYKMDYPTYTMNEIEDYLFYYFKVDKNDRGLAIIDQNGRLIFSKEKSKEEILSSNISKDKKRAIITSMDNSTQELNSKLTYLKNNGDTVWTEEVKGKMIYNVLFLENKNLLLIGDKEIICKNDLGEDMWEKVLDNALKDIEIVDENMIYILYGKDNSTLEVVNIDGKVDYTKSFNKEYRSIGKSEENILLIGIDEILGLRNNKVTLKHEIKGKINDVRKVNDYIVISKDAKTEVYKITDKKNK